MLNPMLSRRTFLAGAGAALATFATTRGALADPPGLDARWIANHMETRLLAADGNAIAGLPRWTRMQLLRELPNGSKPSAWNCAALSLLPAIATSSRLSR